MKPKNIVKEQEIICEDIATFLNYYRDNKKTINNSEYGTNNTNQGDDKGKKKLDILQNIKKQDYSSKPSGNSIDISNNPYESNDNKTKVDFKKFYESNSKIINLDKDQTGSNSKVGNHPSISSYNKIDDKTLKVKKN